MSALPVQVSAQSFLGESCIPHLRCLGLAACRWAAGWLFLPAHRGAGGVFIQCVQAGQRLGRVSLGWYQTLFDDEAVMAAFGLSLKVAVLASAMSVVLGTLAAC